MNVNANAMKQECVFSHDEDMTKAEGQNDLTLCENAWAVNGYRELVSDGNSFFCLYVLGSSTTTRPRTQIRADYMSDCLTLSIIYDMYPQLGWRRGDLSWHKAHNYIHGSNFIWAARLCVKAGCRETWLYPESGCVSFCGVPLSSILWHVALVSTLVYFPLLLLAQVKPAQCSARDLEKLAWLTLAQTETFTSFIPCMWLYYIHFYYMLGFSTQSTTNAIVLVTEWLFLALGKSTLSWTVC